MTKTTPRLASFIRQHCQSRDWSVRHLSEAIGRSPSQVSRYLSGDTQTPDEVCTAIIQALHLSDTQANELRFLACISQAHPAALSHLAAIESRAQIADLCEAKVKRAKQYLDNLGDDLPVGMSAPEKPLKKQPDTDQWVGKGEG